MHCLLDLFICYISSIWLFYDHELVNNDEYVMNYLKRIGEYPNHKDEIDSCKHAKEKSTFLSLTLINC